MTPPHSSPPPSTAPLLYGPPLQAHLNVMSVIQMWLPSLTSLMRHPNSLDLWPVGVPYNGGTPSLQYFSMPPYGTGLIFRDVKSDSRLGWGNGRGFLWSSTVSTTAEEVVNVSGIP